MKMEENTKKQKLQTEEAEYRAQASLYAKVI